MAATTFTSRHLTADERRILLALVDECGPVEVLRTIGQIVAVDISDDVMATYCRSEINQIARVIASL